VEYGVFGSSIEGDICKGKNISYCVLQKWKIFIKHIFKMIILSILDIYDMI